MKVFVIDEQKCNGCHNCQIACKDEHCGNDWSPISLPQPLTGQFWVKVDEKTVGQTPKVRVDYHVTRCNHCENAPCMAVAENGAVYRREDGLVIIDPVAAKGQKAIADACPYGVVFWNEELEVAQKCTGCAHLLDAGEKPHCVDVCTTGALRFGEFEEFAEELKGENVEVMKPELGTKPHVYYLNRPKLFYAGDVYDPELDECLENAKVTLVRESDGAAFEQETDIYGDFWFDGQEAGDHELRIECKGYETIVKKFDSEECLNLGSFPMSKA